METFCLKVKLPTKEEINPIPKDLDGQYAVRHFLGKTREQIMKELDEHGLTYQEDLLFMGCVAFCYYLPAVVDYVMSMEAHGDSDFISSMANVIHFRLEHDNQEIRSVFLDLVRFSDYVLNYYDQFGLADDVYGDEVPPN